MAVNIFVKGDAEDKTGGWATIKSQGAKNIRDSMQDNTENNGINLVIFDADKNFSTRQKEIEEFKKQYNLAFELFLFPNNKDTGALEDLLESIILDKNKPIIECWNGFEACIQTNASKKIGQKLTTPAKKTKIYAYLEVLLDETKKEKDKIKDGNRDYTNTEHWNLNSNSLTPLKEFLISYIK